MEKYTIKKYMIKINKKKNRTLNAHYICVEKYTINKVKEKICM